MKQVTIDNVRERIAELEMVNSHGELSLRGEFELACLRMLVAKMDGEQSLRIQPATDNTAQQFEALATSAQREPLAVVKHYTGNTYPTLKFAQDEWSVCGDREDVQELADAINALATSAGSGKP